MSSQDRCQAACLLWLVERCAVVLIRNWLKNARRYPGPVLHTRSSFPTLGAVGRGENIGRVFLDLKPFPSSRQAVTCSSKLYPSSRYIHSGMAALMSASASRSASMKLVAGTNAFSKAVRSSGRISLATRRGTHKRRAVKIRASQGLSRTM